MLWLYNRKWFIQAQFDAVSETLKDLLEDHPRKNKTYKNHLGADPGFICVLHTWGRQLNLHPHIHCLISAGGLDKQQQWKAVENDYLLPVKLVKALYRSKLQAKINTLMVSPELKLPDDETLSTLSFTHKALYKKEWSVRIQEKYTSGKGVLIYLSRYLGGHPLKPQQITSISHRAVSFRYKDHRDGRRKTLNLKMDEFLRRVLLHQPELKVHSIRYYGIYASQTKKDRCLELLGRSVESIKSHSVESTGSLLCGDCGAQMRAVLTRYKCSFEKPYIKKGQSEDSLQTYNEALNANAFSINSS